jgi:endonuclease YncB( thermonuclease family)
MEKRLIKVSRWRVIDGDTFLGLVRFRLADYRAKELSEDGGKEAKTWLIDNLPRDIALRVVAADIYGRAIVQLYPSLSYPVQFVGGRSLAQMMPELSDGVCVCPRCNCSIILPISE